MFGFEFNKIAAAILVAGLAAMLVGVFTDILYHPESPAQVRGYKIEINNATDNVAQTPEEKINIAELMAKADVTKGKDASSVCASCHNFNKGEGNKVGPDLWDILDRAKGGAEGYSYSSALAAKGGNWDYDSLYQFLKAPRKFLPGTKMGFTGFGNKTETIANVIAYLRSLSDAPKPLPEPSK